MYIFKIFDKIGDKGPIGETGDSGPGGDTGTLEIFLTTS